MTDYSDYTYAGVIRALDAARALIEDPYNWLRGRWASNPYGEACGSTDPEACAWCSMGAIEAASNSDAEAEAAYEFLCCGIGDFDADVAQWNDNPRTLHPDVIAAFKEAVRCAKVEADMLCGEY